MDNVVTHLLSQGSFMLFNKALKKRLGILKAYALTDFIDKHQYLSISRQLVDEEWFFYRREDIAESWEVQMELQRAIIKEFDTLGLVSQRKIGLKNYYRINLSTLEVFMQECVTQYNEYRKEKYGKRNA